MLPAVEDADARFRELVRESLSRDPYPTLGNLAASTGLELEEVVHYALVRWVSAGAEALLSLDPRVIDDLVEARRREDWRAVAGIIDWLEAGR